MGQTKNVQDQFFSIRKKALDKDRTLLHQGHGRLAVSLSQPGHQQANGIDPFVAEAIDQRGKGLTKTGNQFVFASFIEARDI